MKAFYPALGSLILAGLVGSVAACNNEALDPSAPSSAATGTAIATADNVSGLAATLRVRCERRSSRSKISVDGNDLSPRNGSFRARVRAAGGTVTSAAKRAVGDEVEFDFDSNRNDIAAGATRISATFIRARSGPDVIGQLLNAQGVVVASRGVECSFR
jgi:hypothetical protein